MQNQQSPIPLFTNKSLLRKSSFMLMLGASFLFSCKQNTKQVDHQIKPSAKLANDNALKIFMNVIGLKYPKDSLESAVKLYKKALAEDPESKLIFYNFLNCYNYMNKYDASVALCSAWLKKNPEDVDIQYKRAMIYDVQGKNELAGADYKVIADDIEKKQLPNIDTALTPVQIDEILNTAVVIYIAKNDKIKALALLSDLKATFPKNRTVESVYNTTLNSNRIGRVKELVGYVN
jgi:tetratricopeptide (TPR) repeat protein